MATNGTLGNGLAIEVAGSSNAGDYAPSLRTAVGALGALVTDLARQLPSEGTPQDFQVRCGLRALPDGRFVVAAAAADANFVVTIGWRSDGGGGGLADLVPAPDGGVGS